jgi:hypothetical protein
MLPLSIYAGNFFNLGETLKLPQRKEDQEKRKPRDDKDHSYVGRYAKAVHNNIGQNKMKPKMLPRTQS